MIIRCFMKFQRKKKIHCITAEMERCYIFLSLIVGFGFLVMMFISVGLLIYRIAKENRLNNLILLIIVDIVLIISCFDIFCCPFCRERVILMWWARKNRDRARSSQKNKKNYDERANYDLTETLLAPNSSIKQSNSVTHIPFSQL